ncbi:zinc finger protein 320-like [Hyposmocoma kahamanoa]|uniref:zinc finger protein 320-like n=1 Tax=Hyposmocoma kahamanoa TaxID=1477025 RepID=UPI000E6D7E11|nr:zinc finger protein 320-like [Hyposmocoma kahamanoa]
MHSDSLDYPCDICKQRFKTRKRMRIHVRQKHEGYVLPKNKVCEICAKAFTSKKMLEEHMNSHTGARPYVCTTCGATFGYASALYTHNRLRHKVGKIRDREQNVQN